MTECVYAVDDLEAQLIILSSSGKQHKLMLEAQPWVKPFDSPFFLQAIHRPDGHHCPLNCVQRTVTQRTGLHLLACLHTRQFWNSAHRIKLRCSGQFLGK